VQDARGAPRRRARNSPESAMEGFGHVVREAPPLCESDSKTRLLALQNRADCVHERETA